MYTSPLSSVDPSVAGLLESAVLRIPEELRARWRACVDAKAVRATEDSRFDDIEVWVGQIPVWVCLQCDGVFLAPWRLPIVSDGTHHRQWCDNHRRPRPKMHRWRVLLRHRSRDKTRAALDVAVRGVGGMLPWLFMPEASNRPDETWFEVWMSEWSMNTLKIAMPRIRDVRRLPEPAMDTVW